MPRVRVSIASLLGFVAFVAVNLFAFRWAYSRIAASSESMEAYFEGNITAGLLPIGNSAILALCWAARRGPVGVTRARGAVAFALSAISGLVLVLALWTISPSSLLAYFRVVSRPSLWLLKWSGLVRVPADAEKPLVRFVIDPIFMAVVLSGPLMLVSAVVGWIARKSGPVTGPVPEAGAEAIVPRPDGGASALIDAAGALSVEARVG